MGLLTIGMPGDPHGIQDWMPTIADVMKSKGYATGQFGKNHLGERDEHLPTNHGFDEFFGNLYHLNAEEEPEGYFYPKDEEFRKNFGPRGVIESSADGKIEDTGALNTKRMETVDASSLLPRRISSNANRRPTSRSSGDKNFKVHLDGYDLTELKGEAKEPPREAVYYFDRAAI
jgi:arylsulfatase